MLAPTEDMEGNPETFYNVHMSEMPGFGDPRYVDVWADDTVTLPLLRPVLAVVLVITVTGSFQIFDTVDVTTEGGPVNVRLVH